jgi:hypothetical protein
MADVTRSSEPQRLRERDNVLQPARTNRHTSSTVRALLGFAVLLTAGLGACALGARAAAAPEALLPLHTGGGLAGENGLWVYQHADSVVVHWLTEQPAAGVLDVYTGREPVRVRTPEGVAHRAAVRYTRGDSLVLHYGAAEGMHATTVLLRTPTRPRVTHTGVDSLFILGDTHGEFDAVVSGLDAAGLIDDQLRWAGGRKHLVFAGDLTDRGPDVLQLLWFVYRLEREAERAGGRVHVLLGNHEIMVALADLRYVHARELRVAELHGTAYDRMFDVRHSILGRWLASKPAAIRVDGVLIAHGGVTREYAQLPIRAFDDTLRTYVGEELFYRWSDTTYVVPLDSASYQRRVDFFWSPRSVFWHREYVQSDTVGAELAEVLRAWQADMLVVGHTRVPQIEARYDGRLIAAHTPRYGADLLLLVRTRTGHERYRITPEAPPERF